MALRNGESLIATVELLELAANGATVEWLGKEQHALLQGSEAG